MDFYELQKIPISLLDLDIETMSPIIVHEFGPEIFSIVNGMHRLNVCYKKGLKTISAYVGRRC